MKIRHRKRPFCHTIIDNYAEEDDLQLLIKEINQYDNSQMYLDEHHQQLLIDHQSEGFHVDKIFNKDRSQSKVLYFGRKLFGVRLEKFVKDNPLLGFIPLSNVDTTFVQKYKSGSSYYVHDDMCILTALHLIYLQDFKGGELYFPEHHNYKPPLKNNSCLIFPGYERHGVREMKSNHEGYLRYSINHRIYLESK